MASKRTWLEVAKIVATAVISVLATLFGVTSCI